MFSTTHIPANYVFLRGLAKLGEAMPGFRILEDNKDLGINPILQPLRKESVREKDKSG